MALFPQWWTTEATANPRHILVWWELTTAHQTISACSVRHSCSLFISMPLTTIWSLPRCSECNAQRRAGPPGRYAGLYWSIEKREPTGTRLEQAHPRRYLEHDSGSSPMSTLGPTSVLTPLKVVNNIFAYETNGFGGRYVMDDANVPVSLVRLLQWNAPDPEWY